MRIRKAIITAAGPAQRRLPHQSLIDRDGVERSVLNILVDRVVHAREVVVRRAGSRGWGAAGCFTRGGGRLPGAASAVPGEERGGREDSVPPSTTPLPVSVSSLALLRPVRFVAG